MPENIEEENWGENPTFDSQNHKDEVITVVLTADNHLGYDMGMQFIAPNPHKREEFRQRLRHAFQQATDFAIGQDVDLFMQAGDLFDTTTPDEQDRSFVAARLAQLKQAGIRTFAVGGIHDTPGNATSSIEAIPPAPQMSYARLGALHYFAPQRSLEPITIDVHSIPLSICGLGVLPGQEGDPLAGVRLQNDIERPSISLLLLHAPIASATIERQSSFRYILAGYHHQYHHVHFDSCDLIVAGATQHIDFQDPDNPPGFVFLGLAVDGIRWCKHIAVDALQVRRLIIHTSELWPNDTSVDVTASIMEQLRPLCTADSMVQLQLEGQLTRQHYHQLDLNSIRRYGEEHCFAFALDEGALSLLPEQKSFSTRPLQLEQERLSPREELVALANEWIATTDDEHEKKALLATKEELLAAMDNVGA